MSLLTFTVMWRDFMSLAHGKKQLLFVIALSSVHVRVGDVFKCPLFYRI